MTSSSKSRSRFIYATAFMCGAVVMGFELLGSRVLAPYFGNTIFVWGSLISVFMTGLAIGYYLGGSWANRHSSFKGLALIMTLPAIFLCTFPFFYVQFCDWMFELDLGPRLGPLLASLVLFTLPSVFLGAVSPYTVQLLVRDAAGVGKGAGNLYAVSTCGSIIGTLGTSFFLILLMGTKAAIGLLGVIMVLLFISAWLADKLFPTLKGSLAAPKKQGSLESRD